MFPYMSEDVHLFFGIQIDTTLHSRQAILIIVMPIYTIICLGCQSRMSNRNTLFAQISPPPHLRTK